MLLFFKAIYRDPILRGEKRDTIRPAKRLPRVGSVVQACVGPSRIFASLLIESIEPIADLSRARAAQVAGCYGDIPQDAVRISFHVLEAHHAAARLACSAPAQSSIFD